MDLRALLGAELRRRRERYPRYSLRAFARTLGTRHSTLSQLLAQRRRLTPRAIRRLGGRLGLAPPQLDAACVAGNAAAVLRLLRDGRLRPDSRWIATMTGIGATVLVPPSALPDGAVMAVVKDPSGLAFAVCTLN